MRVIITLLLLLSICAAQGVTVTVGCDTDGISSAVATVGAGGTVLLYRGCVYYEQIVPTASGMTFASTGDPSLPHPIVRSPTTTPSDLDTYRGINIQPQYSDITVRDIVFEQWYDGVWVEGLTGSVTTNHVFENVVSRSNVRNGFNVGHLYTGSGSGMGEGIVYFLDCVAENNGIDGFSSGSDFRIICRGCKASGHNMTVSSCGFTTHDASAFEMTGCTSWGNTDGVHFVNYNGDNLVARCWVHSNTEVAIHININLPLPVGATANTTTSVYGCVIHTQYVSPSMFGTKGIDVVNGARANIYNNVIENLSGTAGPAIGLKIASSAGDVDFRNNIFTGADHANAIYVAFPSSTGGSTITRDYNYYVSTTNNASPFLNNTTAANFVTFRSLLGSGDGNSFHNAEVLLRPGQSSLSATSVRLINPSNTLLDGDPAFIAPADFMGSSFESSNVRGAFAR